MKINEIQRKTLENQGKSMTSKENQGKQGKPRKTNAKARENKTKQGKTRKIKADDAFIYMKKQ